MDIHRCRFVPFPPSTINALAFSHSHISKDQKTAAPRLAIGRANGDIEIWNPLRGCWLQETIIRGGKDRSIDGLVWTQDPNEEVEGKTILGRLRLFSVGYTTTVTEWDLAKGRPLRQASGNHGEIWCIAAQPVSPTGEAINSSAATQWQEQSLIAGCTDGALVLYTTKDDDLQLQKVLVRPSAKKAKIISVTFQDRNIVVAGCTDSVVRIFDIRSGLLLRNMSTGAGPRGGPKEVIIWSVKVLRDGTIISGDSTGELKIWDGKTYTLRQRIQSHRQDILSLAVNHDGTAIFSGGMDRRTVAYKPTGKGKTRWAELGHRRFHIHDVKTMASFEAPGISVVVSGGPDASPTVVPLGKYGFEHQRSLPFLPQEPNILSAPRSRLMMSWWDREIRIWRISSNMAEEEEDNRPNGRKLVAKILVKGEANITSASLSTEGTILAVSTVTDLKVFLLHPRADGTIRISKVTLPSTLISGARLVRFSPDTKWLCVVHPDSHINLARIFTSVSASSATTSFHPKVTKLNRLNRHITKLATLGGLGSYDRTVTQLAFSSDSRMLAVSDISGYIDSFVLSGNQDITESLPSDEFDAASSPSSFESESDSDEEEQVEHVLGQHWTRNPLASLIPKLPAAPVALSFRPSISNSPDLANGITPPATRNTPHPVSHELPSGEDRLFVVTATSEVYEFSVLQGSLSNWSRRNPPNIFPGEFRKTLETIRGVIWDISKSHDRVWLWSVGWLWMFDLRKNFPSKENENELLEMTPFRKRKRGDKEHPSGAGGYARRHEIGLGIGTAIKRTIYNNEEGRNEVNEVHYIFGDKVDPMELDDDKVDSSVPLQHLRNLEDSEVEEQQNGEIQRRQGDWHTYKYRPILGVVVIGEGQQDAGPEVAIVERPIFEVDLPPRYYGEQEWRDKETSFDGLG